VTAEINLGDLARVLRAIGPTDPRDVEILAGALGFAIAPELVLDPDLDLVPDEQNGGADGTGDEESAPASATADDLPLLPVAAIQRSERPRPWELEVGDMLEPFDESVHLARIAQHEPLLDPRWSRQVLAHTLATPRTDGELNSEAAVEIVASGRALDPIPLRVRRSLSRGVQVLVDVGTGMAPFARDAWELVAEVERVVGRSQVEMRMFDAVLSAGCGAGAVWTWRSYEPPGPGVPVLALTDLNLSGADSTASVEERQPSWLELSARLADNGSPLALFVPYPPHRWTPVLAERLVLVEWDRTTTVGTVHALRDALHAAVIGRR